MIGACNDGATTARGEAGRSAVSATSIAIAGATASNGAADASGLLDWKRGLEVLREAKVAGVQLTPELLELLLSKVQPGNSRKVSYEMGVRWWKILRVCVVGSMWVDLLFFRRLVCYAFKIVLVVLYYIHSPHVLPHALCLICLAAFLFDFVSKTRGTRFFKRVVCFPLFARPHGTLNRPRKFTSNIPSFFGRVVSRSAPLGVTLGQLGSVRGFRFSGLASYAGDGRRYALEGGSSLGRSSPLGRYGSEEWAECIFDCVAQFFFSLLFFYFLSRHESVVSSAALRRTASFRGRELLGSCCTEDVR